MTPTDDILTRLGKIEALLAALVEQRTVKDWYSTAEVATILGRAEFTVREWCRLGRITAEKKKSGRGPASEWIISHAELTRVRNEGLLPDPRPYKHVK
jgi:transposase